jgi:hypothetical protein
MSNLTANAAQLQGIASQAINNDPQAQQLLKALEQSEKDADLRDFYDIGLWGYCAGNKTSSGAFNVDYCSPRQSMFWFNPVDVWKLNDTGLHVLLPDNLQKALNTYEKVSKWMFVAYMIAIATTAIELVVGISAIFSRLGSCITSLVSGVCLLSTLYSCFKGENLF